MTSSFAVVTDPPHRVPHPVSWSLLRQTGYGFVYWAVIVAALEPGNIANMVAQGEAPRWGEELLRIAGAGLIGSISVPIFVRLSRSFPVTRPRLKRNALIHLSSAVAVAALLIILAHVAAAELFTPERRLTVAALRDDLAANELLLAVGLIALSGLAHLFLSRTAAASCSPASGPDVPLMAGAGPMASDGRAKDETTGFIDTVEVKVRGLVKRVAVGQIDWIEAQGNYLALHIGASTFLLRETLANLQARLDPAHFVRIHRGTIVAVDRIVAIEPAANGDGIVRLQDNQILRASRLYRQGLVVRLPG